MSETKTPSFGYSYSLQELYKKASGIDPLKKAQAKQLINSKAAKINSTNNVDKRIWNLKTISKTPAKKQGFYL